MEEILKKNYDSILKSGMFWEFYPELSGDYAKDKEAFAQHKIKEAYNYIQKGILGGVKVEEWINFLEQVK